MADESDYVLVDDDILFYDEILTIDDKTSIEESVKKYNKNIKVLEINNFKFKPGDFKLLFGYLINTSIETITIDNCVFYCDDNVEFLHLCNNNVKNLTVTNCETGYEFLFYIGDVISIGNKIECLNIIGMKFMKYELFRFEEIIKENKTIKSANIVMHST
jgi:hypothetical protein